MPMSSITCPTSRADAWFSGAADGSCSTSSIS
eukprot:CAMPEP_0172879930 /NCGR_PEP_ID=MMETSP1075-20121228/113788_1 /TAXON_ID=2916 /ORGANISM="Ceratium fusus, Strain PA161109" /LENGTH=31 /DNA_ID= /DNA_START= /DNA_END= /DNA_ORIENTATION=